MHDHPFAALVVHDTHNAGIQRCIEQKKFDSLPPGDVLIQVHYSSLNYKDALSASGNRGVTKRYPHTPGIDAAGIIVESNDSRWPEGEAVICTGYDLGMNTPGGFGQYIRVPSNWLVRLPDGLSLLDSMRLGTAGFTAGQCIWHLERNNIVPENGPVLVTGATGGVGTIALLLLHKLGYEIVAVTGKDSEHAFLISLGATTIIKRDDFLTGTDKQLLPARWQGVVDTIGGNVLANAIKSTGFDGVITCCGNAASADLPLSVYPFILRGVHLIGIYSANCPIEKRLQIWNKLAGDWKIDNLAAISRVVALRELDGEIQAMLAGQSKGRCVVELRGEVNVP